MKKKVIRLVVILILLAAVGAGLWYYFLQDQKEHKNELVLYGNVDIRQVELAFNASERIAEIMVREGESVKTGQLLAVLETVRLQHDVDRATSQVAAQRDQVAKLEAGTRLEEINRARAEVEASRAQADDLERTYRRLRPLAEKNLIAPEQIDQARAKADAAMAQLQAAAQELKLALAGPREEDIAAARSQLKALEAELALGRPEAGRCLPVRSVRRRHPEPHTGTRRYGVSAEGCFYIGPDRSGLGPRLRSGNRSWQTVSGYGRPGCQRQFSG